MIYYHQQNTLTLITINTNNVETYYIYYLQRNILSSQFVRKRELLSLVLPRDFF